LKKHLLVAVLALLGALTACEDAQIPYLTSIAISPANPSVAAGNTQQFTVQGTFSNKTTNNQISDVTWTSSNTAVASISDAGLATTYSQGTTTITATVAAFTGTLTSSTTLTVTAPTLVSVVVTDASSVIPGPTSVGTFQIAKGTTHQFFAYGIYSDGGERNITATVTWSSSPLSVATISNVGLATGLSVGSAVITATDPTTSLNGTATLNVTDATISSIVVSPTSETIAPLTRLTFSALGVFSDGTTQDVTGIADWSSSNTGVATVTNSAPDGIASGVGPGTTSINAVLSGVVGSASLTVSSATLSKITLTPASTSTAPVGMAIGSTLKLNAVGTFSDGSTQTINLAVAWSVTPSDGSIATVDQTGLVTGVAAGTATVTAKFGAVTQNAYLNVETLSSIAITPATVSIAPGTQTQLVATGTLADGTTQDISSSATWISTTPTIATISDVLGSTGWASGIAAGTTTIEAILDNQSASAQLTVTSATLSSIALTPATAQTIALGQSEQYQATATFSDGTTQDLSKQVTWTSSDPAVAVINGSGLAVSTGTGTTTIKAVSDINGTTANAQIGLTVN
jgi:trimeric autotransporter adhesin